ncbi:MAG TPA: maltose alpha-D-glucosyltransferase [Burkholderiales bacterium]|nr:maltose alpha-D-glucosyltransferase [Burkholderiales bacterium]
MKKDLPPSIGPGSAPMATQRDDPLWFKDAVIYQLHVKAFFDSNGDGIGDFRGLTDRLDYIQELGVNTLWVQPFYPSPMLDDGYDVADYTNVYPAYGTRADFRQFVREAHRRGLKIITELIINHTSDQHAWFQAARRAPKGSTKRDYYVWSDDPNKYAGTRIIFTDTESSNWAWDGTAQAHYWHRFFSHQPDLNFDNPHVLKAIFRVMRFWLDMGVDGFRLDAIPYLVEREGTDNEGLPETHDVIRRIRAAMDSRYANRILLAEANAWPEEVRQYFGNGDECQMAYHFPLMPRVYMSIAMEDRHPIVEIMAQTPSIPDDCQWAIFLRNHDELTLEMVTDRERDYMYRIFANDPRMRVNVGIRRRLAPLMENSRTQIELVSFLLMTLPGAPILYYGDEIGMGDNIYLGDRNSVRTPMQWSPDRNAGFSRADPQRLYLPPVMDAIYGYQTVNVEAQLRSASSLLHWTRRMVTMRRSYRAFSRGNLSFLSPGNRKVLAFVREHGDEIVLCVANLSRISQAVELDLSRFEGRVPVEVMGKEAFPPIGKLPYLLTLSGHGYFAFRLATNAPPPVWHDERMPYSALPVLVLSRSWSEAAPAALHDIDSLIVNVSREKLRDEILLPYLRKRPWFAARTQSVNELRFGPIPQWTTPEGNWLMAIMRADTGAPPVQRYFFPLALDWETREHDPLEKLGQWSFAKVRQKGRIGVLYGAFGNPGFSRALAQAMRDGKDVELALGRLRFTKTSRFEEFADGIAAEISIPSLEQSNTGVFFGGKLFLKGYRRLCEGINPEVEVGRFLTEHSTFGHVAPLLGAVEYRGVDGEEPVTLAVLQKFVRNQGDAWTWTLEYLDRMLSQPQEAADSPQGFHVPQMRLLGERIAGLHRALAQETGDPAFDPVAMTEKDLASWRERTTAHFELSLDRVAAAREGLPASVQPLIDELLRARGAMRSRIGALSCKAAGLAATRYHGNLHLGQVLVAENDFVIIDFEGHASRPVQDWRRKHSPLHDVAGILTSFAYAEYAATAEAEKADTSVAARLATWRQDAAHAFTQGYRRAAAGLASVPAEDTCWQSCLALCVVERSLQELNHEMENRPEWMQVPLRQLLTAASA